MVYYDPLLAEDDSNYNPILDMAFAFQKSRILLTACELGIFSIIDNNYLTCEEISALAIAKKDSLERLLNALVAINLLNLKDNKYYNTRIGLKYLVETSKDYIGSSRNSNYQWKLWSHLTESVKTGKPPKEAEWTLDRIDAMIETTDLLAQEHAQTVIKALDMDNFNSVLDLGGGSGYYAATMLKENPHLRITILDYPDVIPITKKYLSKYIDINRFKFFEADFMQDDLGSGYDLVFLSHIINYFSLFDNIKVFQKIYRSLNYGGIIAIYDTLLNDDKVSPVNSALSNLSMLLNSKGGSCYTNTELWIMLKEAYFDNINKVNFKNGSTLYLGYK